MPNVSSWSIFLDCDNSWPSHPPLGRVWTRKNRLDSEFKTILGRPARQPKLRPRQVAFECGPDMMINKLV